MWAEYSMEQISEREGSVILPALPCYNTVALLQTGASILHINFPSSVICVDFAFQVSMSRTWAEHTFIVRNIERSDDG